MSSVYGIVKQSGGYIFVYSEVGQGTTIKIYFPQVEGKLTPPIENLVSLETLHGTETILLVEDEELVRNIVVHTLEQYGYTVYDSEFGAEAIQFIENHDGPIHLLLVDVVLPNMNGVEVAEHLTSSWPGMKVLFISGYTNQAIVQHGVLEKGRNFLEKPFTPNTLVRKVRKILDT